MGVKAHNGLLLVDEFDLSLDTFAATLETSAEALESSNWQSSAMQYQPDAVDASLSITGYYTGNDAGDIYQEVYSRLGTETPAYVAWLVDSRLDGNPVYVMDTAWTANVTIDTPVNDLLKFQGTFEGIPYGGVLLAYDTYSTTPNGAVVNLGAAGSNGGRAYCFVTGITGTAVDAGITIECDTTSGMSTPTDKGAFTFSATGVYTLTLSGTVEQYVRITVDDLGGATDISVIVVLCVADVTM